MTITVSISTCRNSNSNSRWNFQHCNNANCNTSLHTDNTTCTSNLHLIKSENRSNNPTIIEFYATLGQPS